MSTQHTPGPWSYTLEADGEYFTMLGANGEAIVAGCGCCSSPWCRNEADAKLIAAAPDLLAALKALSGLDFGARGLKFDIDRASLMARQAIKKAEGGE